MEGVKGSNPLWSTNLKRPFGRFKFELVEKMKNIYTETKIEDLGITLILPSPPNCQKLKVIKKPHRQNIVRLKDWIYKSLVFNFPSIWNKAKSCFARHDPLHD
jgi:hypothetical protein